MIHRLNIEKKIISLLHMLGKGVQCLREGQQSKVYPEGKGETNILTIYTFIFPTTSPLSPSSSLLPSCFRTSPSLLPSSLPLSFFLLPPSLPPSFLPHPSLIVLPLQTRNLLLIEITSNIALKRFIRLRFNINYISNHNNYPIE